MFEKKTTEKSNYINSYRLYFSQSPDDMQTKLRRVFFIMLFRINLCKLWIYFLKYTDKKAKVLVLNTHTLTYTESNGIIGWSLATSSCIKNFIPRNFRI